MEAAAEGVQDRLVKNGIKLEIRAAPDIGSFVADERRVRQSLFNLLANAVGFSPAGETVTFAAQRLKDAVVFSVTDRGPGIPADVQDKVFDWFETHSLGSRHRGTGLGLSLVRSFVELHGGSVTLESAVGRGTTVTCVFPLDHTGRAHRGVISSAAMAAAADHVRHVELLGGAAGRARHPAARDRHRQRAGAAAIWSRSRAISAPARPPSRARSSAISPATPRSRCRARPSR